MVPKKNDGDEKPKAPQKFRKEWPDIAGFQYWLEPFRGDNTRAYCNVCRRPQGYVAHHRKLMEHALTGLHHSNMTAKGYPISLNFDEPEEGEFSEQKMLAELKVAAGYTRISIPFSEYARLIELSANVSAIPSNDKGIWSSLKMGRTKARNLIVNCIGEGYKQELTTKLRMCRYFSIATDESTDI